MNKVFKVLTRKIALFYKKYENFITEDLIRFIFIKVLYKVRHVPVKDIYTEKPYLLKTKTISERVGIIDEHHPLSKWLVKKSRIRLDLYFSKNSINYCIEFKKLKSGKGWAPDTCFGTAIKDLYRLSMLKQYDHNFECYFICAFDHNYRQYFEKKHLKSTTFLLELKENALCAMDVFSETKHLDEINRNSLSSFNINNSGDFNKDILNGIDYKIIKRFTLKDLNIVLIEIIKT